MTRFPVLLLKLLMDRRVPLKLKIIPLAAILYAVLPTDLIPDFLPFLGWLDDIVILIISALVFLGLGSFSVVAKTNTKETKSSPSEIINGKYRVVDDNDDTA